MQPFATKSYLIQVLLGMKIGEIVDFPIERAINVRVYASQVGLCNRRRYRTSSHRDEGVVKVVRVE